MDKFINELEYLCKNNEISFSELFYCEMEISYRLGVFTVKWNGGQGASCSLNEAIEKANTDSWAFVSIKAGCDA